MAVILRNITVSGFLLSLMLAPLLGEARADIYQCIDQQGGVLFTDTPTRTGCRLLVGQKRGGVAPSSWSPARFDDIILSSSQRYGVDPALVRAVVKVESDFNEAARSHKGAQGLMQLMPETARLHNVGNVYDPDAMRRSCARANPSKNSSTPRIGKGKILTTSPMTEEKNIPRTR